MSKNKSIQRVFAVFSVAVLLLGIPLALPVDAQASTVQMGGMPTYTGSGTSGALPAGATPAKIVDDVRAFLSFSPNPIGVGQTLLVNLWTNPPISPNRIQRGYSVEFTRPDGTTFTVGPFNSYAADATAYFTMVVDQVGEWKVQFSYAGQYYPAGYWRNGYLVANTTSGSYFLDSAYYSPAESPVQTLVVQDAWVASWPGSPLPTDYWTRPVHFENREWWSILGAYPPYGVVGGGPDWPADTNAYMSNYNFVPYVEGPETSHVVMKKLNGLAGLIGGTAGQYGVTSGGNPNVIYMGRAYQTMTVPINGVPTSCACCYDIRTGEMFYSIPIASGGVTPQVVSYTPPGQGAVEGAAFDTGYSVSLLSLSGNRLIKINPATGAVTLNVTGMTPQLLGGMQGSVAETSFYSDPYVYSVQTIGSGPSLQYRLIKWTTAGTSTNFTSRILSNFSLPWGFVNWGGGVMGYGGYVADFEANVMVYMVGIAPLSLGVYKGTWMTAIDLNTGQMLWNKTYEDTRYSTACLVADHGKVACLMEQGYYSAYDLRTGNLVWESDSFDYPWSSAGFGAYAVQSAYGMLYRQAYDGVYAFDWDTGDLVWHFISYAPPYETPYTDENGTSVYSFNGGGFVADGKLYTYNTEHTPTYPRTRGWKLYCIDAFTGVGIWNITGAMSPGALGDGYLINGNPDDGYIYSFGKGKTATTVSAPQTQVAVGEKIIISGTVMDLSPAQPNTPCVSRDSMTTQMEFLHMQLPIDGVYHNVTMTGVPVSLVAIDPNYNSVDIGTAVSDPYYGTFNFAWAPEIEGTYTIIASFVGDDSYGSSGSSTAIVVGAAADVEPTATPMNFDAVNNSIMMTLAVLAVLIIIGIVVIAFLLLRKR